MTQGGKLPVSNPPFWIIPVSQGVGVGVDVGVGVGVGVGEAVGVAVGVTVGVAVAVGVGVGDGHGTSVAVRARHFVPRQACVILPGVCFPPVGSQIFWVNVVSSNFTPTTNWLSLSAGALTK
ncbi:MAG: hypothetical protein DMF28_01920 [Verrucomicrobia bacterium]|nr:MAG: hypothetical protein DMF28_01920 [Verrucomicrobiota bacterium]